MWPIAWFKIEFQFHLNSIDSKSRPDLSFKILTLFVTNSQCADPLKFILELAWKPKTLYSYSGWNKYALRNHCSTRIRKWTLQCKKKHPRHYCTILLKSLNDHPQDLTWFRHDKRNPLCVHCTVEIFATKRLVMSVTQTISWLKKMSKIIFSICAIQARIENCTLEAYFVVKSRNIWSFSYL